MFKENTFDFFIDIFLLGIIQKVRNGRGGVVSAAFFVTNRYEIFRW